MPSEAVDVAVVGGGPAGLAAAATLRAAGAATVVVLERDAQCGGAAGHCGHRTFGLRETGRLLSGAHYIERLVDAAMAAGVSIRTQHTVRALEEGPALDVVSPQGRLRLSARRVILATGARETPRSARLVSGDRPLGVLTTGALQEFVYRERLLPFRRPVIVGTELVGLSSLLTCRKHGIRPVAVIEGAPGPLARWPLTMFPALLGLPQYFGVEILEIQGGSRVEAVSIRDGTGQIRRIECDGVLFTGRFVPEWTLAEAAGLLRTPRTAALPVDQFGRTADPRIFAAGNGVRAIESAGWCWSEGRTVAACVMADLSGRLPAPETGTNIEAGPGIRFATPSRVWPGAAGLGFRHLQLRLSERFDGRLIVRQQGRSLWHRTLRSSAERRILIPIAQLGFPETGGTLTLTLERERAATRRAAVPTAASTEVWR